MAKRTGITNNQEWDSRWVFRDARPYQVRLADKLGDPRVMTGVAVSIGFTGFFAPSLAIPLTVIGGGLMLWWKVSGSSRKQLPLQVPEQAGLTDRSVIDAVSRRPKKGEGILYLGNNRLAGGESEECWVSNSEARTHFLIAGTTGSGKTMTLLGMVANALTWGSGCIYVDGKADNGLYFNIYSMARRMGREDHVYVLNFMTGGMDIFSAKKDGVRRSNSFNPFSRGAADDFIQLVVSLMPPSGGDNAMWQGLAVGMIDAVIRNLCLERAKSGQEIDAGVIRDAIQLDSIIAMARKFQTEEPGTPPYESAFKPIKAYLINLPGINWAEHVNGNEPFGEDTKKQHDFRSMQFLRQLTMLADTYGKVFRQQVPEVDMMDIVLNNRILIVMIPSMEKSEEESGAVGKLVVTALRMIMALNLGDKVEGMYEDAVESKATNSSSPYIVILDELGYYFTKGLAVIFAQARSLGFAMVAAMQDFPALKKGSNKEEAESVIANTKFKESLAMEDSDQTAKFFLETAGKAIVSEVSGYSGEVGVGATSYRDRMDASINERERVTLQELRDMDTADSIMMWRDRIVRMRTFAPFLASVGGAKALKGRPVRMNRLIGLHPPSIADGDRFLSGFAEPIGGEHRDIRFQMELMVAGLSQPVFAVDNEGEYAAAIQHIANTFPANKTDISGKDGDVALFARLAYTLEAPKPPVSPADQSHEDGETGGTEAPEIVGDEFDAAKMLDSLPVEVTRRAEGVSGADQDGSEDIEDISKYIMDTVLQANESVVVKASIKEALAITDSILSATPPGDAVVASEILMEGVSFEPARPLAEPVNQGEAEQQVEDILRALMED